MTDEIESNKEDAPTAIELQLSKRISKLRAARGRTQDQLAAATGFTNGYLSKIENSKVIPAIGTLVKIAQVLDTDVAELLEPEDAPDQTDAICVVRSWQRESVIKGGSSFGYDYAALAHKRHHKQMEPFIMVFPSKVDRDIRFEHEVEFEATVDGRNKTWILSPGDSVYFDSRTPHRGRSLNGESRALVMIYRSKATTIS